MKSLLACVGVPVFLVGLVDGPAGALTQYRFDLEVSQ